MYLNSHLRIKGSIRGSDTPGTTSVNAKKREEF